MDLECVRTDGISSRYKKTVAATILPEYGCLIVSPANLWKRDAGTFQVFLYLRANFDFLFVSLRLVIFAFWITSIAISDDIKARLFLQIRLNGPKGIIT